MSYDEQNEVIQNPEINPNHEFIIAGFELNEILDICNDETTEFITKFLQYRCARYDAPLDSRIEIYVSDNSYQVYFDDVCVYEYRGEDARFEAASTRIHQLNNEFMIKSPHGFQIIGTDKKPKGFHVRLASEKYRKQDPYPPLMRLKDKCLQN